MYCTTLPYWPVLGCGTVHYKTKEYRMEKKSIEQHHNVVYMAPQYSII